MKTESQNKERNRAIGKAIGWNIIPLLLVAGLTLAFSGINQQQLDTTVDARDALKSELTASRKIIQEDSILRYVEMPALVQSLDSLFKSWTLANNELVSLTEDQDGSQIEGNIAAIKRNIDLKTRSLRSEHFASYPLAQSLANQYYQRKRVFADLLALKATSEGGEELLKRIEEIEEEALTAERQNNREQRELQREINQQAREILQLERQLSQCGGGGGSDCSALAQEVSSLQAESAAKSTELQNVKTDYEKVINAAILDVSALPNGIFKNGAAKNRIVRNLRDGLKG
ncbi:MAG: hypothetical protein AAF206_14005 [Bacteroidota bacterium]